jgi:RNA polymerase sigma-70 factor (ECF subfamily)
MKKVGPLLWEQLKKGDKQSFEVAFKACYPQLCLFSKQFTKDMDASREVVQELFVYLWENKEKIKAIGSVQSYVYASLRFNSIRRRQTKSFQRLEIAAIPEKELGVDFHDEMEFAQLQQAIYQTIESLPPQCRKIFKMSRPEVSGEKLTYQEIANLLGISPKTVEAQISKALRNLRKTLAQYLGSLIVFLFL